MRSTLFGIVLAASKPKNMLLGFGAGVAVEGAGVVGVILLFVGVVLVGAALSGFARG